MDNSLPINMLRIVLPHSVSANEVQWYAFDTKHVLIDQGISAIESLPAHKILQWILPASAVAGHALAIPTHAAGRNQSAMIDQMLEDVLLSTRDEAHVVLAAPQRSGLLAWVCDKSWINTWLNRCRVASLEPGYAYAIYDLLPESDQVVAAATAEGTIFRQPDGQTGYLEDPSLLEQIVDTPISVTEDLLSRPTTAHAANILTSALGVHDTGINFAMFRRSAWLAGGLAITVLLGAVLHWQRLETRERQLKDEIRQTFAANFPGTPIVDPYLQWQSLTREKNTATSADAFDQLSKLATMLSGNRPRSAEFRDGTARLVMTESDLVTARAHLQREGLEFNTAPAEPGFTRLEIRMVKP